MFVSASYVTGAILLDARPEGTWRTVWAGDEILSRQEEGQELRCVEWKTGKVMWAQEGFGAEASPRGFQPKLSWKLLPGVVRAYPTLADGRIFVRNVDTLVAVRLVSPR